VRLIDADRLLDTPMCNTTYCLRDAVKYGWETPEQRRFSYETMMLYEIADMIEDAPTYNGWISTEDVLPEEGADVLAHSAGEPTFCLFVACYERGAWFNRTDHTVVLAVSHWHPLPAVPEQEG